MTKTYRTITLTSRPPVRINDEHWPLIASASDKFFDGEFEHQANRTTKLFIGVRRHQDGRTLVYATSEYSTCWQGERNRTVRHGYMIKDAGDVAICARIKALCELMEEDTGHPAWSDLCRECIADMPAEELE